MTLSPEWNERNTFIMLSPKSKVTRNSTKILMIGKAKSRQQIILQKSLVDLKPMTPSKTKIETSIPKALIGSDVEDIGLEDSIGVVDTGDYLRLTEEQFSENLIDKKKSSLLIQGNALTTLKQFPDKYFRCCITSPPYWGLRDYEIENQIGAEVDLNEYIDNLVEVFQEVNRTLADDGTFWLNIGDSYTSGNRTWRHPDKKNPARGMNYRPPTPPGLKPKDLIGVPWRLAFALQSAGWYLRSDIIWYKPNCQPESVKDRPTQAHEYLFLFSKSEKYFYDYESLKEPALSKGKTRNRRSVWPIKTEAYNGAHFATFPPNLIRPCIIAGSQPNDFVLDPFLGSGTVGQISQEQNRKFVGIELKPEYIDIAEKRIHDSHE